MTVTSFSRTAAAAFTLAVWFPSAPATAQVAPAQGQSTPVLQLSLDEAVRRAVENNPDLSIVRLGTDVQAARVGESRTVFSPIVSAVAGSSRISSPPSSFLVGDQSVDVTEWFSSTGVRQRLPWKWGGTWGFGLETSRTSTNSPFSSFDPTLQSGIQFAFSQPLLKDRDIDAAREQYIIAKRDLQITELAFRESVVRTVASVKQAYWTLKATIANVSVQQRSLELADELARQNRIRVDAGQIAPIDLVQAQAEVAQRRENLIRANTAVGDAEDALRRLIIDPADAAFWQVRIEPTEEPTGAASLPDVEAAVANALKGRLDIARAGEELENLSTNIEFLDNQKLPDVRLELLYRGNGLGGTQLLRSGGFPGDITGTRDRSFVSSLGQVFTPDFPSWSFGVTVSHPIGRSFEEASLVRARIERQQAAKRIESLRIETAENVRQAARQVRSTAERIDASRAGAALAQERFDAEQRRYEVGLSTTFLVTQAQRDLLQAQVNLLQTILDHESSIVNFEAVQQAPPLTVAGAVGVRGNSIVNLPTSTPRGIFRSTSASDIQ